MTEGQRVAEIVATVPGTLLRGLFGLVGLVRPAAKPLHPAGSLHAATVNRTGLRDDLTGVAWIDEVGTTDATVRLSRATGLPAPLPDIHGLAVRMTRSSDGGDADILFATTGLGRVTRFVLAPSLAADRRAYTTLLPYRSPSGPLLLAAVPRRDSARFDLACATLGGAWRTFGDLHVHPDAGATGDRLSFDPVLNQLEGLAYYPWLTRLREGAYSAARWSRKVRSGAS